MGRYYEANILRMSITIKRPAIRYFGGKFRLADWIISHFPAHSQYVEPFAGGASVLLKKQPAPIEIYNDLNGDVVNFFKVLRENPDELVRLIELTPYSREEVEICRELNTTNPVESARRFYAYINQRRAGGDSAGWRFIRRVCNSDPLQQWNNIDHLYAVANRLKGVYIENIDALTLIKKCDDSKTLFYVDPPYYISTRTKHRYAVDTSDKLQLELAQTLNSAKAMIVLSGYRCPAYDEYYADWKRVDCKAQTGANNTDSERGTAIESLWINKAAQDEALEAADKLQVERNQKELSE